MSDLTVSNKASHILSLAEEFGINLQDDMSTMLYSGGESKYTNYRRPKEVRTIFDAHKLDGVIKWTEPDFDGAPSERVAETLYIPRDDGSEPKEINGITELRGLVVNYQQQDRLSYFDGEKTQTLCSVIGVRNKEGDYVRDLPGHPYGMKYEFEKDRVTGKWKVADTKPDPIVEKLGLVGFRGERVTSCADCIRCGMSTELVAGLGENGADKKISCEPRGKLYFAVFEVGFTTKVKSDDTGVKGKAKFVNQFTTYEVKDLVDFGGEPIGDFILIEVPMSKSSIQGKYVKGDDKKKDLEKSVDGYQSYVRQLAYDYKDPRNPMSNPRVHFTSLTFKKHPFAPTFQANFDTLGVASVEQFKSSLEYWQDEVAPRELEILNVVNLNEVESDGTINITARATEAPVPAPRKVEAVVEVVSSDVEDEEMPF